MNDLSELMGCKWSTNEYEGYGAISMEELFRLS